MILCLKFHNAALITQQIATVLTVCILLSGVPLFMILYWMVWPLSSSKEGVPSVHCSKGGVAFVLLK